MRRMVTLQEHNYRLVLGSLVLGSLVLGMGMEGGLEHYLVGVWEIEFGER